MGKKYIFLLTCFAFTSLTVKANNKQLPVQVPQQTIPQTQYNDGRGSVTGIINRIPRTFDTQTLINSGPGLLQEGFFLLRKLGKKKPQEQSENKEQTTTVTGPQDPAEPSTKDFVFKDTQTISTKSSQDTNTQSNSNTIFTNSPSQTNPIEPIKPVPNEIIFTKNEPSPPMLMVPAPRPGYIIRYNEQLKVYEEVREIKIQEIQAIQP